MVIIISYETKNIINIFYNVTKILHTSRLIIIIINDNKLIMSNIEGHIIVLESESKELNILNYINIYVQEYLIIIIFIIKYSNS